MNIVRNATVTLLLVVSGISGAHAQSTSERQLPWSRPDESAAGLSSMVDLLELYQISREDLQSIPNAEAFSESQVAILARLVYRLAGLQAEEFRAWRKTSGDWAQIAAEIEQNRGQIFHIRGRLTHRISIALPAELQESLEFSHIHLLTIELDSARPARLLVKNIPQAWLHDGVLPTDVAADALLLDAPASAAEPLLLAAGHVAWFPTAASAAKGVLKSHTKLAQLGVDIALIDQLKSSNSRELTAQDRPVFYQMLSAAQQADTSQLPADLQLNLDLEQLLVAPEKFQAQLFQFEADARRITWIEMPDQQTRQALGIAGYYEIDITIPLGDRPVRLSKPDSKGGPIYEFKYPATLCVLRLPPELQEVLKARAADPHSKPLLNQHVQVAAYFFKIWTYRSKYVASHDPQQMHLSPLFLGTTLSLAALPPPARDYSGPIFATAFITALVLGWFFVWRTGVRDRLARQRRLAKPTAQQL